MPAKKEAGKSDATLTIPEKARTIARQHGWKIRFPHHLYDLVEYCHLNAPQVLTWYQEGELDGLVVRDDEGLMKIIRDSKIFKLKSFASLQHQLNDHGFSIDKNPPIAVAPDDRVFRRAATDESGSGQFKRGNFPGLNDIKASSGEKKRKRGPNNNTAAAGATTTATSTTTTTTATTMTSTARKKTATVKRPVASKSLAATPKSEVVLGTLQSLPPNATPLAKAFYEIAHDDGFIASMIQVLRHALVVPDSRQSSMHALVSPHESETEGQGEEEDEDEDEEEEEDEEDDDNDNGPGGNKTSHQKPKSKKRMTVRQSGSSRAGAGTLQNATTAMPEFNDQHKTEVKLLLQEAVQRAVHGVVRGQVSAQQSDSPLYPPYLESKPSQQLSEPSMQDVQLYQMQQQLLLQNQKYLQYEKEQLRTSAMTTAAPAPPIPLAIAAASTDVAVPPTTTTAAEATERSMSLASLDMSALGSSAGDLMGDLQQQQQQQQLAGDPLALFILSAVASESSLDVNNTRGSLQQQQQQQPLDIDMEEGVSDPAHTLTTTTTTTTPIPLARLPSDQLARILLAQSGGGGAGGGGVQAMDQDNKNDDDDDEEERLSDLLADLHGPDVLPATEADGSNGFDFFTRGLKENKSAVLRQWMLLGALFILLVLVVVQFVFLQTSCNS